MSACQLRALNLQGVLHNSTSGTHRRLPGLPAGINQSELFTSARGHLPEAPRSACSPLQPCQ